jgi:catechol 2,3-dioxygenase-like lactoylglutathione lyase family enzyme
MGNLRILGVGHTGITVSDLDRSIAFYREVLGQRVSPKGRLEGPFFETLTGVAGARIDVAFVSASNHMLELLHFVTPERHEAPRMRPNDPGFLHICLKVKDIEQIVAAIRRYGFEGTSAILTVPGGPAKGMRAIYVRDPDGVCLELIDEPPGVVLEDSLG